MFIHLFIYSFTFNLTCRAPLVTFGGHSKTGTCTFGVIDLLTYMKKNKALIDEVVPKDGFVGIGNFDENWGYLRQVELPDFALLYI